MNAQLDFWDETDMELVERLASLESDLKHLTETVERNRSEAKHYRNNLSMALDGVKMTVDKTSTRLDSLFILLEQAQGAKKAVATIFAVLTFFSLTGLWTVYQFISGLAKP